LEKDKKRKGKAFRQVMFPSTRNQGHFLTISSLS
jgi:hypothetical protein